MVLILILILYAYSINLRWNHTQINYEIFDAQNFSIEYREDITVIFSKGIVDRLNDRFMTEGPEYLLCLVGKEDGNKIYVEELKEERLLVQEIEYIIYEKDPPCQFKNSIGSIHSHPKKNGCVPSADDMFTFGEMKNPEPLINIIQCDTDNFTIFKMPGKQEWFDFRMLKWIIST